MTVTKGAIIDRLELNDFFYEVLNNQVDVICCKIALAKGIKDYYRLPLYEHYKSQNQAFITSLRLCGLLERYWNFRDNNKHYQELLAEHRRLGGFLLE